nr:zinc protease PQQL-like isoform X5 [Ipomoea batatas]
MDISSIDALNSHLVGDAVNVIMQALGLQWCLQESSREFADSERGPRLTWYGEAEISQKKRAFKYAPAKSGTPNPCFIGPLASNSPATIGYEENKELFSMGKIEN